MQFKMAAGSDWSLLHLPPELLEEIILSPVLSLRDVCRLRAVSWYFHELVSRLWGKIAAARWQYWGGFVATSPTEWHNLCRQRHICEVHSRRLLNQLVLKGLKVFLTDDDDLEEFGSLVQSRKCSPQMLDLILCDMLRKPMEWADLTDQFYARYAREHVVRHGLKQQWEEFLSLPEDQQHMEKGAVLLTQWINPCQAIQAEDISKQLDDIADKVARELLRREGMREEEVEGLSAPKCSRIEGSQSEEDPTNCRMSVQSEVVLRVLQLGLPVDRVLESINTVLYSHLGFRASSAGRYYELHNSFIDKVLERKTGIPISMSTLYEAVARRLGVRLVPVNFPSHFLLKLAHEGEQPEHNDLVFIDAFSRGLRLTPQQCLGMIAMQTNVASPDIFLAAPPAKVFMRMVANIYSNSNIIVGHGNQRVYDPKTKEWSSVALTSALSLQLLLCSLTRDPSVARGAAIYVSLMCTELRYSPQLVERVLSDIQARISMGRINPDIAMLIQRACSTAERKRKAIATPPKVKQRTESLCHYIGTIKKHKRYDYLCVIYGWDHDCDMSEDWIQQMGVDTLPRGRHQPFYNVLVDDGTNRYAAEENLLPCPPKEMGPVMHWEVGKYFCKFTGDRYIPNFALKHTYPEDNW